MRIFTAALCGCLSLELADVDGRGESWQSRAAARFAPAESAAAPTGSGAAALTSAAGVRPSAAAVPPRPPPVRTAPAPPAPSASSAVAPKPSASAAGSTLTSAGDTSSAFGVDDEGGVEALIWRLGGVGKGMDLKAGVAAVLAMPGQCVLLVWRYPCASLCVGLSVFVYVPAGASCWTPAPSITCLSPNKLDSYIRRVFPLTDTLLALCVGACVCVSVSLVCAWQGTTCAPSAVLRAPSGAV